MNNGQKPDVSRVRAEQSILVTKEKRLLGIPGVLRIPGRPGYTGIPGILGVAVLGGPASPDGLRRGDPKRIGG